MMTWHKSLAAFAVGLATVAIACGSDDTNRTTSSSSGGSSSGGSECAEGDEKCLANAELGAQRVKERKCVDCHNSEKGTMAGATTPLAVSGAPPDVKLYPPNLTPDEETGIGDGSEESSLKTGWSDDKLVAAMRTGIDKDGLELCPQMKHDSTMKDYEAYSIVKYLRSLPPINNKVPRSVCPPLKE